MAGWFDVSPEKELLPGQAKLIDVDNVMIAVLNIDGEYHAIDTLKEIYETYGCNKIRT